MAISVVNGNIPYYGVFSNNAVLLNGANSSLNPSTSKNYRFRYVFPWEITFGGNTYYAVFDGSYYLYFYKKNPDTEYILRKYYNDSDWVTEKVYGAVQPYLRFYLLNPRPVLDGSSLNSRCYVYEHSDFVLFHFDFFDGDGGLELVITKTGYIQYNSTGKCRAKKYDYYDKTDYFSTLGSGCTSCGFSTGCPSYNASNTSCVGFGSTYCVRLSNTYFSSTLDDHSKFLLTPPSSGVEYSLSTNQHLDLSSYLNISNGEVSLLLNNEVHRVPLRASKVSSLSNLSLRSGGATKYVAFSDDNGSDKFSEYTPIRLRIDGSTKSPYLPRVKSNKRHTLYDVPWEQPDFDFYTNTGSSYRYYRNALLYTLSERVRVKQIRLFGYLNILGEMSMSECELPRSNYSGTLMMINTGTSDLTSDWTPNNTDQSITFEAGYIGSGGKQGQMLTVVKDNLNLYIKQFAFTPSCSYASSVYLGGWLSFEPEIIELVEYSTGNTYYISL